MKKMILILAIIVFPALLISQEQTFFGNESASFGLYCGPELLTGNFENENTVFAGVKGGIIFNGNFSVGGGGYSLTGNHTYVDLTEMYTDRSYKFDMNYGGLILEYMYSINKSIHFTLNTLIGSGTASFNQNNKMYSITYYDMSSFLVLTPGATIEMNLFKNMWVNFGINYLLVSGSDLEFMSDSDLSGIGINFALKFSYYNFPLN
jgi:hypothetical protein